MDLDTGLAGDLAALGNDDAAQQGVFVGRADARTEYVKSSETVAVSWFGVRWLAR